MSTVKTDAITAVSTNGDLSLDGLGTGGVSIASTLKMTKGGDIASASPLVIDTDGNYFDVTGTTSFSVMTVEAGNFFMLQFDGALTITHGSGIELPGAANLTTAAGDRLICYATAANTVEVMSVATEAAAAAGGICAQVVNTQTGAQSTGTTQIPWDDTIPQITEGTEFMTLAVTPDNTNNILIIEVVLQISRSSAGYIIAALFQDSTANALDAVAIYEGGTGGEQDNMVWRYKMIAGTTSETTFRVRAGPNASATVYFNGDSSRKLGGVFASSITVREYTV